MIFDYNSPREVFNDLAMVTCILGFGGCAMTSLIGGVGLLEANDQEKRAIELRSKTTEYYTSKGFTKDEAAYYVDDARQDAGLELISADENRKTSADLFDIAKVAAVVGAAGGIPLLAKRRK